MTEKKAAVVKKDQENSQVCVLCCATDRNQCCPMSRECPLQQVPSTLQTGDLGKEFLHHQEPGTRSNLAWFFLNKGSFPPTAARQNLLPGSQVVKHLCTVKEMLGSPCCELFNSSLPDAAGTQERISPVWCLGPSVLNRAKNSWLVHRPFKFRHTLQI